MRFPCSFLCLSGPKCISQSGVICYNTFMVPSGPIPPPNNPLSCFQGHARKFSKYKAGSKELVYYTSVLPDLQAQSGGAQTQSACSSGTTVGLLPAVRLDCLDRRCRAKSLLLPIQTPASGSACRAPAILFRSSAVPTTIREPQKKSGIMKKLN